MITIKTPCLWLVLFLSLLLVSAPASASGRHGPHEHDKETPAHAHEDEHDEAHADDKETSTHQHPWWEPPPPAYAQKRSTRWTDPAASARGEQLFRTYCMVCHGADGKGTGPAAKGLPHPPADLTHHFHNRPGDGDAYLFWRVSEGGMVEPFKSMKSTMPAFKTVLSAAQRWDVLAYVHTAFHRGFKSATAASTALVVGEGKVIAVLPGKAQIVVDHKEIKGFMGAMIMGYTVNPPSLLEGLTAGEQIRFTVDPQQKAIVNIEPH